MAEQDFPGWHGTTIIGVRKGGKVVIAGDGQVSLGQTVIKGTARKVRRLSPGGYDIIAGFAGSEIECLITKGNNNSRLKHFRWQPQGQLRE